MRYLILCAAVLAAPAAAETRDFNAWCKEIKHYPAARCQQRSAADFDDYRAYADKQSEFQAEYDRKNERPNETWGKNNRIDDVTPDVVRDLTSW